MPDLTIWLPTYLNNNVKQCAFINPNNLQNILPVNIVLCSSSIFQLTSIIKMYTFESLLLKKHAFTYTRSINRTLKITEYVMILVTSIESIQNVTQPSDRKKFFTYIFYRNRTRFRIHRPSVENSLVLIVASVKYNRRSEKNIANCFFHIKLIRTESKSIIADQDRVILKLYSTKYTKHNKTNCMSLCFILMSMHACFYSCFALWCHVICACKVILYL
jgi:hypothetical protein